jgi:eukaryotic-like serine/threonine-protein kinase
MADNALPRSPPPFPEKVGKYELLLPIGTGGMATVYLARSTGVGGFERDVALKLVHAHLRTDEDSKLQLLEEAKLAARIRHPNVVPVMEVDEDPLGLFLVMDYVEGDTLSGLSRLCRLAGKTLPLSLIGRILNDALLGLHAAHELTDSSGRPLNLVHRDFSPQNILVSVQGMTRLADFGVAKAANRAVRTKTGLIKGKISYMSPEQARGQAIDRRCDVWAAGVVAWELIAGRRMHRSDDDVATLLSIVTEDPPTLRSVLPDVPKALDDAVAWALTPDTAKRCPTAEDLRRAISKAVEEHGGIADTHELARFVQQLFGPKLSERRASASEVRTLRRRMVELARARTDEASDADAAPSPPQAPNRSLTTSRGSSATPLGAFASSNTAGSGLSSGGLSSSSTASGGPGTVGPSSRSGGPGSQRPSLRGPPFLVPEPASATLANVAAAASLEREELTQTSAVVPLFEAIRRDRKRAVIGAIAALGLLVGLALALSEALQDDSEKAEPTVEPRNTAVAAAQKTATPNEIPAPTRSEASTESPVEGPDALATADGPDPTKPASENHASSRPARPNGQPRQRPPATASPPAGGSRGKTPKLAGNPYAPKPEGE